MTEKNVQLLYKDYFEDLRYISDGQLKRIHIFYNHYYNN